MIYLSMIEFAFAQSGLHFTLENETLPKCSTTTFLFKQIKKLKL